MNTPTKKDEELMRSEALLREMEDDIRREQLTALWKRYGGFLLGGCVAIVIGTAAYVGWTDYTTKRNIARTDAIYEHLAEEDGAARLDAVLAEQIDPKTPQEWLTLFYGANDALEQQRFEDAKAIYAKLRDTRAQGASLRFLADLMALRIEGQSATEGFDALRGRYEELGAATDNPWRALAYYDAAIIAGQREKNYTLALELLDKAEASSFGSAPMNALIGDIRHLYTIQGQNAGQDVQTKKDGINVEDVMKGVEQQIKSVQEDARP